MKNEALSGTMQSHTVIRVAGKQYAGEGPFVLLLVELRRRPACSARLGAEPPPIGSRVAKKGAPKKNEAPLFQRPCRG